MKYIDANSLREEIVFMRDVYNNPKRVVQGVADAFRQDGRAAMCDDILAVMDAMEKDQQEQQEVDLEEEIEEYRMVNEWSESIPLNSFKVIARYFYGLGQLNSK